MAIFSNQATLTYNGASTNSNIAYGEILDVLTATKTSIEGSYSPGSLVTYAVTLRNTGNAALSGAKQLACHRDAPETAQEIVTSTQPLELSSLPQFPRCFAESMRF